MFVKKKSRKLIIRKRMNVATPKISKAVRKIFCCV